MNTRPTDIRGMRFGRLVAIEPIESRGRGRVVWRCVCDCGNEACVLNYNLLGNHTLSCGCLRKERQSEANKTHGMSNYRLYRTWAHMKERCLNKNVGNYSDYGGRGITICEEWKDFSKFSEWAMSSGYSDKLTIERIDNNKGYSPDNCRWITLFDQASNKRSNHLVTINGKTDTVTNWARRFGMRPELVFSRLHKGWSEYEALTIPKGGIRCQRFESRNR